MPKRRRKDQLGLFESKTRTSPGRPRKAKHAGKKSTNKRTGHGTKARKRPVARKAAKPRVKVAGYRVKAHTRKAPKTTKPVVKKPARRARRARRVKRS